MSLRIVYQPALGKSNVELEGRLDRTAVPEARKTLLRLLSKKVGKTIEMDFSGVPSMDTAGVALLIEVFRVITSANGELRMVNMNDGLKQMLQLAKLNGVLQETIV